MKSDKKQQNETKNSQKQTSRNQSSKNALSQADGFRYDYDDSSDLK